MSVAQGDSSDVDHSRLSSTQLFAAIRAGKSSAVDVLYSRYLPRLRRAVRHHLPHYLKDTLDTGDLVQDALERALPHLEEFEPRHQGAFLSFLREIVRNRIRDEIRRRQRRPESTLPDADLTDDRPTPLEQALGRERVERYEKALSSLRPSDREVIVARFELGFTHQEVARELGLPSADAARVKARRALEKLAEAMTS
jgi:RNA polymerase sigma-70 factor (ECF subfamily)